ncbi:uncharacterized protein LOC124917212 [Impatiens glandulifera]|uniref:uncharacterized protein LOC124917212 n=1 Tax=Impatiens glandulifera TaxID=253017 RepID=UPI001FB09F04|nr:uncharacterized protein LOC124917212 [Impatiens glandulifera]
MSVDYIWHDHPLQLRSITRSTAGNCFVCSESVNGYNYRCPDCDFFLHISCLFFPLESLHPLHPTHPLSLQIIRSNQTSICNHCNLSCSRLAYRCSPCNFTLHLPCASRPREFNLQIHKHPLSCFASPPNQSSSFLCYICGESGYGFNLACLGCHFIIHVECASYPVTVTTDRHRHPFTLTSVSSVDDGSGEFYCDIVCETSVNPKGCVYFCDESECQYMAHLGCLTYAPKPHIRLCYKSNDFPSAEAKKEKRLKPVKGIIKDGFVDSDDDMRNRVSWIDIPIEDGDAEMVSGKGEIEINHFSHQHPLILSYNKHDRLKARCFGCLDRIKADIAYTCSDNKCNFWGLHKWCGDLPTEIRHPLHSNHPLSLLKRAPDNRHPCIACNNLLFSYSFVYNCKLCYINIHAICASISTNLKSEVHDHPLQLRQRSSSNRVWCYVCGFEPDGAHFICELCGFAVDFSCALLPKKVSNDCHVHPLTLTNVVAPEDETEFICDACEGVRNGFSWVYYCEDCEYSAHTSCALYEVPGTKQSPIDFERHEHILSLITNSSSSSSSS